MKNYYGQVGERTVHEIIAIYTRQYNIVWPRKAYYTMQYIQYRDAYVAYNNHLQSILGKHTTQICTATKHWKTYCRQTI